MVERDHAEHDSEKDNREKSVSEEPKRLAAELSNCFVLRDVVVSHHEAYGLRLLQVDAGRITSFVVGVTG
jgi:hypothetical protein